MESFKQQESAISDEMKFEIKQDAQLEILQQLEQGGDDVALEWVEANSDRFNKILNDPKENFYELLADEETHREAVEKIKERLYH